MSIPPVQFLKNTHLTIKFLEVMCFVLLVDEIYKYYKLHVVLLQTLNTRKLIQVILITVFSNEAN